MFDLDRFPGGTGADVDGSYSRAGGERFAEEDGAVQPAAEQNGQRPGGGTRFGHHKHCMFGLPLNEEPGYHVPMTLRDAFPEITRQQEPLAPFTKLRVGGAAEFFVRPRSVEELAGVLKFTSDGRIPVRILGAGNNVLVRDEGVSGAVVRLGEPAFNAIAVNGKSVRADGGALLSDLISQSVKGGLAGLETLVGIAATVGGAVRANAGDRNGRSEERRVGTEGG